jgi:hypothetical protein
LMLLHHEVRMDRRQAATVGSGSRPYKQVFVRCGRLD